MLDPVLFLRSVVSRCFSVFCTQPSHVVAKKACARPEEVGHFSQRIMVSWHAFSLRASFVLGLLRRKSLCKMDTFAIQGRQGWSAQRRERDVPSFLPLFLWFLLLSQVYHLNGVFCHFSFLNSPSEIRMCVAQKHVYGVREETLCFYHIFTVYFLFIYLFIIYFN